MEYLHASWSHAINRWWDEAHKDGGVVERQDGDRRLGYSFKINGSSYRVGLTGGRAAPKRYVPFTPLSLH